MKKMMVSWVKTGKTTLAAWLRKGVKLAYHPGKNPKRPLPGPFYDLSVVGLFVVLAIGYFVA